MSEEKENPKFKPYSTDISQFLQQLDQYNPTIPENASKFILESSGLTIEDPRISKFVSLVADKFLVDTIREAKLSRDLRNKRQKVNAPSDQLEMTDLDLHFVQSGIYLSKKRK